MDNERRATGICLLGVTFLRATPVWPTDPADVIWQSVRKSPVREEYELYLKQYSQGRHAQEAGWTQESVRATPGADGYVEAKIGRGGHALALVYDE